MNIINYLKVLAITSVLFCSILTPSVFGGSQKRENSILIRTGCVFFRTGDSSNNKDYKASNSNGVSFLINNKPVYFEYKGKPYNATPARTTHPILTDYKFVGLTGDGHLGEFQIKIGNDVISCPMPDASTQIVKHVTIDLVDYEIGINIKKEMGSWMLHESNATSEEAKAYLIAIEYIKRLPKESPKLAMDESLQIYDQAKNLKQRVSEKLIEFQNLLNVSHSINELEQALKQAQSINAEIKSFYDNPVSRYILSNSTESKDLSNLISEIDKSIKGFQGKIDEREKKASQEQQAKIEAMKMLNQAVERYLKLVNDSVKSAEGILNHQDRMKNSENAKKAYDQIKKLLSEIEKFYRENLETSLGAKIPSHIQNRAAEWGRKINQIEGYAETAYGDIETIKDEEAFIQRRLAKVEPLKEKIVAQLKQARILTQVIKNATNLTEAQIKGQEIDKIYQEVQYLAKDINQIFNQLPEYVAETKSKEIQILIDEASQFVQESLQVVLNLQETKRIEEERIQKESEILTEVKKQLQMVASQFKAVQEDLKFVKTEQDLNTIQDVLKKAIITRNQARKAAGLVKTKAQEIPNNIEAQQAYANAKNLVKQIEECVNEVQNAVNRLQEEKKRAEEESIRKEKEKNIFAEVKRQEQIVEAQLKVAQEALKIVETTQDLKIARQNLSKIKSAGNSAQKAEKLAKSKTQEISNNSAAQQASDNAKRLAKEVEDCFTKGEAVIEKLQEAKKQAEERIQKETGIINEIQKQKGVVERQLKLAKAALDIAQKTQDLNIGRQNLVKIKIAANLAKKAADLAISKSIEVSENIAAQQASDNAQRLAQELEACVNKAQEAIEILQEAQKRVEEERIRKENERIEKENTILNEIKKQKEIVGSQLKAAKESLIIAETTQDLNVARQNLSKIKSAINSAQKAEKLARLKAQEIRNNSEAQQSVANAQRLAQEIETCVNKAQEAIERLQEVQKRAEDEKIRKENERIEKESTILNEIKKQKEIVESQLKAAKEALIIAEATQNLSVAQQNLSKIKSAAISAQKAADLAKGKAIEVYNNIAAQQASDNAKLIAQEVETCVNKAQVVIERLQESKKRAEEERLQKETEILNVIKKQQQVIDSQLKVVKEAQKNAQKSRLGGAIRALKKAKKSGNQAVQAMEIARTKSLEIGGNIGAKNSYFNIQNSVNQIQGCIKEIEKTVAKIQTSKRAKTEKKAAKRKVKSVKNSN